MHYLGLWENKGTEKGALKQYSENAVFAGPENAGRNLG